MIIEKKKISDLKPASYNPRKSNEKQEANLKKSLEKFGVVEPIIFNKQTGHIVGGHFRVRELKKLGHKEVECVIVDLNEDDEKELNIRLNANTGEWNWEELQVNWDADKLDEWGLDVPDWGAGSEFNTMSENDIDITEEFDPIGVSKGLQRVVFIFNGREEAESYLKSISIKDFSKRGQAWQVNMSSQSI